MPATNFPVFQDLKIHGSGQPISQIREAIIAKVAPPWLHEREREQEMARFDPGFPNTIVISREGQNQIPAIGLVLSATDDGYEVVNIVPQKSGSIGIDAYNRVLNEFYSQIIEPASRNHPWTIELTKANWELEDWLGGPAAKALRAFSAAANKSTGASHPRDEERWFQFIVEAHASNRRSEPDLLRRWLIEVDNWPERQAMDLAAAYERATSLLRYYDEHH